MFKTTVLWLIMVLISSSLLSEGLEGKTVEGVAATFGCKTVAEGAVADSGLDPKPVAGEGGNGDEDDELTSVADDGEVIGGAAAPEGCPSPAPPGAAENYPGGEIPSG